MRNQNPLMLGILAAGALAYYFLLRKKPASPALANNAARSTPSGGGNFVQSAPSAAPITGAPVPNLQTALATQGVSALGQILSALTKSISGGGGSSGGGGGGRPSSGGASIPHGSSSGGGQFSSVNSGGQTLFYDGTSGNTVSTDTGSSYTDTSLSADQLGFGDIGSPTDVNAGSSDPGSELNVGGDLQSVDYSGGSDFSGGDFSSSDFSGV